MARLRRPRSSKPGRFWLEKRVRYGRTYMYMVYWSHGRKVRRYIGVDWTREDLEDMLRALERKRETYLLRLHNLEEGIEWVTAKLAQLTISDQKQVSP